MSAEPIDICRVVRPLEACHEGNTAAGAYALLRNNTGNFNTANGCHAGRNVNLGSRNVGLCERAGHAIATGSDNIAIGTNVSGEPTGE